MTSTQRCPECYQSTGHKMSCDTGYRARMRARAAADGYGYGFETTAASLEPLGQQSCSPLPSSAPAETPGTCGGGE